MGKKVFVLLLSLVLLTAALSADSYRLVPNYGHLGRITAMGWDKGRNVLLTLGEDDYCLAIDRATNRVLNRIPLEGTPALYTLNPVYPEIAVVTERDESFLLTLFDWQTGKILTRSELKSTPFFMKYSRSGNFLLTGSDTVHLLNHENGEQAQGPGGISELLTYGYLGGSEKTFMGYSPSGALIYYDRYTSQIQGRAETEEDLTDLTILREDVRLLTARREGNVFLIDRQTGRTLDTLEKENILSYYSRGDDGSITILEQDGSDLLLSSYRIRRDRFSRVTEKKIPADREIAKALYTGDGFILGTGEGTLLSLSRRGSSPEVLLPASPLIIDHLTFSDNRLLLKHGMDLTLWESPFFEQEGLSTNHLLNLTSQDIALPLEQSQLTPFDGKAVIWQPDEKKKYPYYILTGKGELTPLYEPDETASEEAPRFGFQKEMTYGFRELNFLNDLETVIDEDKTCRVYRLTPDGDSYDREEIYTYAHQALETASMVSEDRLALGTNTYYGGRNSVSLTNIVTGESVPLSDERTIVTAFLPDGEGKGFFSLGFAIKEGASWAVVKYHDFNDLSGESKTVLEFPQPTTNQCRLSLGENGTLYVTTPNGSWRNSGTARPADSSSSLDKVCSRGGYLYLIDRDHSLVIYREETLFPVARVFFFSNGEWMAVSGDKRHYFYSSQARDLFSVYKIKE